MAETTKIEWCDATFNPWIGCTKVSLACDNCYAETYGKRFGIQWGPGAIRKRTSPSYWRQPLRWNRKAQIEHNAWEQFKATNPGLTDAQLQDQGFVKPTRMRVFCASLGDVFDNNVPVAWRLELFDLINSTPYLDWLLLTKRVGNAEALMRQFAFVHVPFPNVWLGATVCNQEEADRDIPKLLAVPAGKRFLSIEPMLGPCDVRCWLSVNTVTNSPADARRIDWVICGGETGPHARPMHPDWVRWVRNQCVMASVPFFFKGWGDWFPRSEWENNPELVLPDDECVNWPDSPKLRNEPNETWHKVGKKSAGRELDGVTWDEVPQ